MVPVRASRSRVRCFRRHRCRNPRPACGRHGEGEGCSAVRCVTDGQTPVRRYVFDERRSGGKLFRGTVGGRLYLRRVLWVSHCRFLYRSFNRIRNAHDFVGHFFVLGTSGNLRTRRSCCHTCCNPVCSAFHLTLLLCIYRQPLRSLVYGLPSWLNGGTATTCRRSRKSLNQTSSALQALLPALTLKCKNGCVLSSVTIVSIFTPMFC